MTDPVTLTILGEPVAFLSTQLSRSGIRFKPGKQRAASEVIRMHAIMAMDGRLPFDESLRIVLVAEIAIPMSWSRVKQNRAIAGELLPGKKPDLTNYLKLAEDALLGVVYRDDCLICEQHTLKRYSVQPKLVITVSPIGAA